MLTVGDAGSQAVAIAKDLMHLCATKVLLGQDDQIGDELSDLLGLTPMAERIVTDWATAAKGRALWLVGSHVAKVQTVRTSIDVALTNTRARGWAASAEAIAETSGGHRGEGRGNVVEDVEREREGELRTWSSGWRRVGCWRAG